jgi:small nuclear ribonucleoprotein (snRNP)-like protein
MPEGSKQIPYTAITIIFIALAAAIGAFLRRINRDRCLKDFEKNFITLQNTAGRIIWGILNVGNTGLEFVYPEKQKDEAGQSKSSYLMYKSEYPNIRALIRFHDELSEEDKKERTKELKRTYHPCLLRRLSRKTLNFLKTVRDSMLEVVNLLITHAKKAAPAGGILTSQDKYVTQMKQDAVSLVTTSFEPLLEKYIGRRVVLELSKNDKIFEYHGVLKDYTAQFIEIMDVDYKLKDDEPARKADLVVPRQYGTVRHLGE